MPTKDKKKNVTFKRRLNTVVLPIQGEIQEVKSGWKKVYIYGEPYTRGYAHGYLLFEELNRVKTVLPFIVKEQLNKTISEYMKKNKEIIVPIVKKKYFEFYEELRGISDGARYKGVDISVDYLIAWNAFLSLYSYYDDGNVERCTAFIACGNATENNDIVMAHNTHSDFATGQLLNIVLHVNPKSGNEFVMQTSAGFIASSSDWFISKNGIIGCETTISNINYKPVFGAPYFCRIRQVMQYANSLDDCVNIMSENNAGDYASSWLFGNTTQNEIMLFELGLKTYNIQKTKNGVFYGMNTPISFKIRNLETFQNTVSDISTSSGSRNERLNYLLNEKYYGKINIQNAKLIISDHYDSFLKKEHIGFRNICRHSETEEDESNRALYGSTDSKITNSKIARKMEFWGRFGSGCGRSFKIKEFVNKYSEYKKWENVVDDFKPYRWVII
jgi:hypothetical protein